MNWIDVKDKMPESGEDVLVCNCYRKKKNIWIACHLSELSGTWQKKGSNAGYLEHVVAWMPLPKMPVIE